MDTVKSKTSTVFMHYAIPSVLGMLAILSARSLLLAAIFIIVLPLFLGHNGIYLAISIAEFFTFIMALYLFKSLTPQRVMG